MGLRLVGHITSILLKRWNGLPFLFALLNDQDINCPDGRNCNAGCYQTVWAAMPLYQQYAFKGRPL